MKLNNEQQQAVMTLGQNVVVSASAGAGKTAVLIQRLMKRILKDHVDITEVCALTFTDAAANEMKVRLLKALNQEYIQTNDLNFKDYLNQQITLVETANISTIHSFCLSLIKNYGYVLGIDPARSQNILDPAISETYKQNALDKTLQQWFKDHPEQMRLLTDAFVRNPINLSPLKTAISNTASYLSGKPNRTKSIQDNLYLYSATAFEDFPKDILELVFKPFETHIAILVETFTHLKSTATFVVDSETLSNFQHHLYQLETLKSKIEHRDISFYDDLINTLNIIVPTVRASKKDSLEEANDKEAYKQAGSVFADALNVCLKYYYPKDSLFETLNQQKLLLKHLFDISLDYLNNFDEEKVRANGFDFDDFEYYALKILQHDNHHIAHQLKNKYKEIMVDEYQDTNEIQDEIIQLISNGSNVFRVGDVKQSIYRFRGAKPSIMQNLMEIEDYETIHFMFNYRSTDKIVAYTNTLFQNIMQYTPNSNYTQKDMVSAGRGDHENDPLVELQMITLGEEKMLADDKNTLHATAIANRIIQLHQEHNIPFKDITILSRRHADKIYLKKAFEVANIPHFVDDRSGFFKSNIIQHILDWLNYTLSLDDYYLVSVLTSPFIKLSYDDVASLKVKHNTISKGLKIEHPDTAQFIESKRLLWKDKDIVSVLTDIININNVYHEVLSIQVKTNIDALMHKALQYQNTNNPTLQGFMHYVENLDDENNPESTPLDENEDVVRVSTIHQSKGLEYPVVILWPMGRRQNMDFKDDVLTDSQVGVLLNDVFGPYNERRKNFLRSITEFKQDQEDLEEYIRLLYVAITRARDHLIMIDVVDSVDTDRLLSHHLIQNFKRSTDLIYPVMNDRLIKHTQVLSDTIEPLSLDLIMESKSNETIYTSKYPTQSLNVDHDFDGFEFNFNENFIHGIRYGNLLHEAVENLPHRTWNDSDLKQYDANIQDILIKYNQNEFTQRLYSFDIKEHEMPFIYLEKDIPKQGIIDFYAVNNDEFVIVDFKSDNTDAQTLITRYQTQIEKYVEVLSLNYPNLKASAYIYSFRLNAYLEVI